MFLSHLGRIHTGAHLELAILVNTIATVMSIGVTIGSLAYWLGRKFAQIEERFRLIDEKFRLIDERFRQIDERFKQIDERFRQIDERFRQIDERFRQIDERFAQIDKRFAELEERLRAEIRREVRRVSLLSVNFAYTLYCGLVDFLSLKGIVTPGEREFLIREAERLSLMYGATLTSANPLKREDLEYIQAVLRELREKDPKEFDVSKLEKAVDLVKRALDEAVENLSVEEVPLLARLWQILYMLKAAYTYGRKDP